ncbi:MAG: betC 1 [Verrucomicrobiales bacterium]|nr:betC 1 [Verrucomicrobiales bacterium]
MINSNLRCVAALFAALLAGLSGSAEPSKAKPINLLIITADDMNADSWFNSKVGATPHLDAFAKSSYRFEQMHVSAPICQPSRSALMTGRVPHRNGALGFNPINLDVPTLTEVCSSNGYFTAALNKVSHMAPASKFKWDLALDGSGKNPERLQTDFAKCLSAARDVGKPFFINANITDPHRPFAGSRGGKDEEEEPAGKKRLKKNEANSTSVPIYKTNEIIVPEFLEDIPDVRSEVALYFSSVRRLDMSFTGLMAALEASGEKENTVIFFMSDHGMSFPYAKATIYRNGTWSPLLVKFPGMKKPFVNTTDMISSVDVMPTALELMNVPKPSGMDGRSLVSLLEGEKQQGRDHVFTHVNTVSSGKSFPGRCVRTKTKAYIWNEWPDGTKRYKVEAMGGMSFNALAAAAEKDPRIKERVQNYLFRTPEEFYDEQKDPSERRNLIKDPACQKDIQAFKKLLLAEMEKTNDPLLEKFRAVCK